MVQKKDSSKTRDSHALPRRNQGFCTVAVILCSLLLCIIVMEWEKCGKMRGKCVNYNRRPVNCGVLHFITYQSPFFHTLKTMRVYSSTTFQLYFFLFLSSSFFFYFIVISLLFFRNPRYRVQGTNCLPYCKISKTRLLPPQVLCSVWTSVCLQTRRVQPGPASLWSVWPSLIAPYCQLPLEESLILWSCAT